MFENVSCLIAGAGPGNYPSIRVSQRLEKAVDLVRVLGASKMAIVMVFDIILIAKERLCFTSWKQTD